MSSFAGIWFSLCGLGPDRSKLDTRLRLGDRNEIRFFDWFGRAHPVHGGSPSWLARFIVGKTFGILPHVLLSFPATIHGRGDL